MRIDGFSMACSDWIGGFLAWKQAIEQDVPVAPAATHRITTPLMTGMEGR